MISHLATSICATYYHSGVTALAELLKKNAGWNDHQSNGILYKNFQSIDSRVMYRSYPVVTEEKDCFISTAVLTQELLSVRKILPFCKVLEQILEARKLLIGNIIYFCIVQDIIFDYMDLWSYSQWPILCCTAFTLAHNRALMTYTSFAYIVCFQIGPCRWRVMHINIFSNLPRKPVNFKVYFNSLTHFMNAINKQMGINDKPAAICIYTMYLFK